MGQLSFGIFHVEPNREEAYFYKSLGFDYINTYLFDTWASENKGLKAMKALQTAGKTAWISVTDLLFEIRKEAPMVDTDGSSKESTFNPVAQLKPEWKRNLGDLVGTIRTAGCWDCFRGIYMDEPLLWNISLDDLKETTGCFRKSYPEKGVFICFSIAGVAPDVWTVNNVRPITADAGQFITDVAYDMYHKFNTKTYTYIADQMKHRMGDRTDLKIWYIPCTMDYRGDKDEQHCLDHLNGCYELLKKEKNPGGLFCYNYRTFTSDEETLGNVGLDLLTDPAYKKYWNNLERRIGEIGREICCRP